MWATEIPGSSVTFNPREEEASLHLTDVLVFDTFTVANSLDQHHPMGPKVKAIINSLRIEWSGTIQRRTRTDCADAFRGSFFEDSATIEVVATTPPIAASQCPPRAAAA